jgi:hypothetical protein
LRIPGKPDDAAIPACSIIQLLLRGQAIAERGGPLSQGINILIHTKWDVYPIFCFLLLVKSRYGNSIYLGYRQKDFKSAGDPFEKKD